MKELFEKVVEAIEEGLYSVITRPDVVLLNILAFLVLVLLVKKLLWSKVTTFLEGRQSAMHEAITNAEEERKRSQALQEKSVKDYEAMKEETRVLKEKLMQDAYREQEVLINNAKKEAKRRLSQAEKDIQFEIAQANEEIKQSIKTVAFAAAEKIVKREIDESMHEDIIDEILNGQVES